MCLLVGTAKQPCSVCVRCGRNRDLNIQIALVSASSDVILKAMMTEVRSDLSMKTTKSRLAPLSCLTVARTVYGHLKNAANTVERLADWSVIIRLPGVKVTVLRATRIRVDAVCCLCQHLFVIMMNATFLVLRSTFVNEINEEL